MDTVTYPDGRVAHFLSEFFVPARVKVKEDPRLAREYLVIWTPNVVIADGTGKVHYRVEGYLPPEEFMARVALGLGRFRLARKEFDAAAERFSEVSQRHHGSEAGAEALYWLGVTRYKQSGDKDQLRTPWQQLAQDYPESEWTRRSQVPGTTG